MTTTIQDRLFEITLELLRVDRRLTELHATIKLPSNLESMQEDLIPHSVNAYLSGIIGCVRSDLLSDAIMTLNRASVITAEELRAEHQQLRRVN